MRERLGLKSGCVGVCDGGIGAKGAGLVCGSGDVHVAVHCGVKCGPGRPGPEGAGLVGSTDPNVAVESESVGGGSVVIGSRDVIGSRGIPEAADSLARTPQAPTHHDTAVRMSEITRKCWYTRPFTVEVVRLGTQREEALRTARVPKHLHKCPHPFNSHDAHAQFRISRCRNAGS